jgi:hypothetical protein
MAKEPRRVVVSSFVDRIFLIVLPYKKINPKSLLPLGLNINNMNFL